MPLAMPAPVPSQVLLESLVIRHRPQAEPAASTEHEGLGTGGRGDKGPWPLTDGRGHGVHHTEGDEAAEGHGRYRAPPSGSVLREPPCLGRCRGRLEPATRRQAGGQPERAR